MKKFLVFALLATAASVCFSAPAYDLIIRNGRIIDGTGNPWFRGDIAVKNGRVEKIGIIEADAPTSRVIEAQGLYVAPGFIDVHTHCEDDLLTRPIAENFIRMGVTTVITGNCGGSYVNLGEAFTSHTQQGIGINMASLVGHNSVRARVMGNEARDPSTTEIAEMRKYVEQAMNDGAVGLSTGLIYTPGLFSKTPEIIELAKEVARFNGVYATHMRSEGTKIYDAIKEALEIGSEAGIPVQISHFKITSPRRFGESTATIEMVEEARRNGQDVTVDQYLYTASSTSIRTLLPEWAVEGDTTTVRTRINDPAHREKIIAEIIHEKKEVTGRPDMSYAYVANFRADPSINGKNIKQVAQLWKNADSWRAQVETILDMVTSGSAGMVFHSMDEGDVRRIAAYPNTMFASDSGVREFGAGVPHPRGYGNNARVLGRYVRDEKVLRLEDAVRKMTSLPARSFRFFDRGILRAGAAADIAVFDLDKVNDPSTFDKPHAYAQGFQYVLVNGALAIDNGQVVDARKGQVLLGPGADNVKPQTGGAE